MIYDSSILFNKSKSKKEIRSLYYKKIKLLSLQKSKIINNKNFRYLSPSNKFKNRRILNENELFKTKLKITNNLTNSNDTINSLIKSDFSSCENIIKKARDFHNNASNETDFTKKNDITFLTENNYNTNILHSLNFNSYLNDYLQNNNLMIFFNKSISNFKEKNRIQRRINFLNNFCKNLIKSYKKSDIYEKFEEKVKKSELKYRNYKNCIDNYLLFLKQIKIKEEQYLSMLIKKKVKLIESINILNKHIDKYKKIKNEYIEIKDFLLKVKGKKNEIKKTNTNIETNSDNYPNIKSSDSIQRLEKRNQINKSLVNLNSLKLYLSPIKQRKKMNNFLNINISEVNKTPRNRQKENYNINNVNKKSKFNHNISKSVFSLDEKPIFSSPEEFINSYEEKIIKMRNSIDYYSKSLKSINILKNENLIGNNLSQDEKQEKKLYSIIDSLKKENLILQSKLIKCKKIDLNQGFNIITKQAKKMILNVNLYYNLKAKFDIYFDQNFEKPEQSEQTLNEKKTDKNLYLLKILEKIIDVLKEMDKNYKEDPKNIDRYKRVKSEIENVKFEMIRKRKLNNLRLRQQEKSRKILEHHSKIRFFHLNKNGINLNYFNNSTHYSISSFSKDILIDKKIKAKREEIKSLLSYN